MDVYDIIKDKWIELCDGCNEEIMYESPDNFDPVCMNESTNEDSEDGFIHGDCCCACEENDMNDMVFKTVNFKQITQD
tara:strand:+ start:661 stop:894 length:234 start_codon:yes stop_codon:yes gene_type:complete